jgi:hypothetical protein
LFFSFEHLSVSAQYIEHYRRLHRRRIYDNTTTDLLEINPTTMTTTTTTTMMMMKSASSQQQGTDHCGQWSDGEEGEGQGQGQGHGQGQGEDLEPTDGEDLTQAASSGDSFIRTGKKDMNFTINSTIVQKREVKLQLRILLTDPVVNSLSLRALAMDVKNSLQNSDKNLFLSICRVHV